MQHLLVSSGGASNLARTYPTFRFRTERVLTTAWLIYFHDSRPSKTEKWTYVFYIECEGHLADDVMVEVIGQIEEHSIMLKRLGSYPRAPI